MEGPNYQNTCIISLRATSSFSQPWKSKFSQSMGCLCLHSNKKVTHQMGSGTMYMNNKIMYISQGTNLKT